MSNIAMKYEDWLRECVHHDGKIVYLPCDIVLAIADWIEAHRDAVPVVRCKDCKWKADTIGESWCDFHEFTILSDDDFCSYGERSE